MKVHFHYFLCLLPYSNVFPLAISEAYYIFNANVLIWINSILNPVQFRDVIWITINPKWH